MAVARNKYCRMMLSGAHPDVGANVSPNVEPGSAPAGWQNSVMDAMPVQIAMLDGQGRILAVNRAWSRFAGEHIADSSSSCVGEIIWIPCVRLPNKARTVRRMRYWGSTRYWPAKNRCLNWIFFAMQPIMRNGF